MKHLFDQQPYSSIIFLAWNPSDIKHSPLLNTLMIIVWDAMWPIRKVCCQMTGCLKVDGFSIRVSFYLGIQDIKPNSLWSCSIIMWTPISHTSNFLWFLELGYAMKIMLFWILLLILSECLTYETFSKLWLSKYVEYACWKCYNQ